MNETELNLEYKDLTEKSSQGCHHFGLLGSVHGLNTTYPWVSRVQAMDRAQESKVVAALARFLSHVLVHLPLQSGQDLPPSCQKRETPYISMRFSSTAGISSMSLSTEVSVSYTFVANNQHEQEETA